MSNSGKKSFEQRLKEKKQAQAVAKAIAQRAITEWPTMREFNQALRYLEVFAQLMKLKPFLKWMMDNIEIHDQIDHERQTIDTLVMYKGPEGMGDDIPDAVVDLQDAEQPLCDAKDPLDPIAVKEPERSPDQNIVCCPKCQLTFDANVEVPRIELATEIPPEMKK